jgi:prepilin-type N-terminal cleavage/methylation domain-containing protein
MSRGFTLVEVLLSAVIIGMLVGLSAPVYASFQTKNELEVNTQTVAELFRRASTYARGIKDNSQWGVQVSGASVTLFKGASYAARDTTADESLSLPGQVAASGLAEVVFAKASGLPSTTGTVTLTAASTNDTRTVTLNAKGMVAY